MRHHDHENEMFCCIVERTFVIRSCPTKGIVTIKQLNNGLVVPDPPQVVHSAPPMGHHEPENTKVCRTKKTSLLSSSAPQQFKDILNGVNQNKPGLHNTLQTKAKNTGHGKTLSCKKLSARYVEKGGHIEDVNLLVNVLLANCPDFYICNFASQVMSYIGDAFTDLTGMFETIDGSIGISREEKQLFLPFLTKLKNNYLVIC